jgi:CheY-like chemotaxis protein/anti-sigma regulatory factor (Ser/Thr protein kinase)
MNGVLGMVELLLTTTDLTDRQQRFAQMAYQSGELLLSIINDILDLSKIEAGKVELEYTDFNLPAMVEETVELFAERAHRKNLELLCTVHHTVPSTVQGDALRLRQILTNLLNNAIKFTAQGEVMVCVTLAEASLVRFEVRDTGIGIPPALQERIFKAFAQADGSTTRQYGGTGLGLAITQRFCQMMGGDITVESALGQGSTFTIRLPAAVIDPKATAAPRVEAPPASALPEGTPTVLVIDDDSTVHDLMQRFLRREGLRMATAASGEEGLRLARELRPAAITLDVLMPGMDGWAMLTALKADPLLADIPVIMLTIVDDKNLGYALGAADYLTKPIDWERLAAVLTKYRCAHPPCTVLVVEDDADTRALLRRLLTREGWAVTEATNGRVALERMAESHPELILLDLMMPEMDGFAFLEALRQQEAWRSIPVVVVTAKDLTPEDRQRLNGYVEQILQKGAYSREALLHEIQHLVAACLRSGRSGPAEG